MKQLWRTALYPLQGPVVGAFLIKTVISIAISFALSALSNALFGKKAPTTTPQAGFTGSDRSFLVRSAAGPGRVIYGRDLVSGTLLAGFNTDANAATHLFIGMATHEVAGFDEYRVGTVRIPLEDIDADGRVWTEPFGGLNAAQIPLLRIKAHLGADDQVADADAVAEIEEWTEDHRLRGIAYIYVKIGFASSRFPNGIPNFRAVVRGKKVFDTRDSTTKFTTNPALIARDWLLSTQGVGAAASEIDETVMQASANVSDEAVTLAALSDTFTRLTFTSPASVAVTRLQLDNTAMAKKWRFGDAVKLTTDDTLPAPLAAATTYYFIPDNRQSDTGALFPTGAEIGTFQLAASHQDALDMTPIAITDAGTGTHTIDRISQLRYEFDGSFGLDAKRIDVAEDIMTTLAAPLTYQNGAYQIHAATAATATVTITEDDLAGPIKMRPRVERRELFNRVIGTLIDADKIWEKADFPAVENSLYESQDGDERLDRSIDLRFIQNAIRAQRIAKIHLEKSRQGITLDLPCKWTVMQVGVWDTVLVTLPKMAWTAKKFRVLEWKLAANGNGINLTLQEEADAVYAWNAGDATEFDPAPDTDAVNPFNIAAPQAVVVTEALFQTRDSAGVKARVDLSWNANTDGFFNDYEVSHKLSADSVWTTTARVAETTFSLFDIAPGLYDFRVRTRNTFGALSDASTVTQEIFGLAAPPADITGIQIQAISSMAIITIAAHPDLDVLIGGQIKARHSPLQSGASWAAATNIGETVSGDQNMLILPLKAGTYLLKAIDSTGVQSVNAAAISSEAATVVAFANLGTVTEHTAFIGPKDGVTEDGGILKLAGIGLIDDEADFDAIVDFDLIGGPASSGTYDFAAGIDLGSVKAVRVSSHVKATTASRIDLIDSRSGLIDDWVDFDGAVADEGDAQVWFRVTDDDPNGSPTWGAWERLAVAEKSTRGLDFQCRISVSDTTFNEHVEELSASVEEVA